MKADRDLTMRDHKHCKPKKQPLWFTDSGVLIAAFVIGLLSCGVFIFPTN
jgi:hypothetical protein